MDPTEIEQIRSASFNVGRRGYEPAEVDGFLSELAARLEQEPGSHPGSEVVRRELELMGEKTSGLLAEAEESAQRMHADAVREASSMLASAREQAEANRARAETHSATVDAEADERARTVRAEADEHAARVRGEAERYVEELRGRADAEVEEASQRAVAEARLAAEQSDERRTQLVAEVSDLERRRDEAIGDLSRLVVDLERTVAATAAESVPGPVATEPAADAPSSAADDPFPAPDGAPAGGAPRPGLTALPGGAGA